MKEGSLLVSKVMVVPFWLGEAKNMLDVPVLYFLVARDKSDHHFYTWRFSMVKVK